MSTPESKEMLDILKKLQSVQDNTQQVTDVQNNVHESAQPVSVSPDAQEMYNILYKLEKATTAATKKVVNETVKSPELSTATLHENTISINGQYNIEIVEHSIIKGVKKKFYNIKNSDGDMLYSDIALFESAMGIVKGLMFGKNENTIEKIVDLDERYSSYLTEAAMYKQKAVTLKESYKQDVALAKQGSAVTKMNQIKKQIKTLL